jgi:hypothetical protein
MEQEFDRWNEIKKRLAAGSHPAAFPTRGEIWMCSLGKNLGRGAAQVSRARCSSSLNSTTKCFGSLPYRPSKSVEIFISITKMMTALVWRSFSHSSGSSASIDCTEKV